MTSTATLSTTSTATATSSTSSATSSCINVTPGKNGYVPEWACNSNYSYDPSLAGALVFAIAFGITTFIHIFQAVYYKRIKLCWAGIMGAVWEFASFCIRVAGTRNQQSSSLATSSQLLLLLAPMWVNAFDYMILGRMIYYFVPEQQVWGIKGIKLTKIFVWLDVLSFITQAAGGILITPSNSASVQMTGIHIYMGGIGLQQFCILIFTSIATRFFYVMQRQEKYGPLLPNRPHTWRRLLYVLYASLALISARIIFRLIEWSAGEDPSKNPLPFHEAYFMCLDALPMFIALILMNIVHPASIMQGEGSEFPKGPSRKEKKAAKLERKAAKKEAKMEKKMEKEARKMKNNGVGEEYV